MGYSIIFQTKIVKLSDGRILHLDRSGCNNDTEGRRPDDWTGKIYTPEAFVTYPKTSNREVNLQKNLMDST